MKLDDLWHGCDNNLENYYSKLEFMSLEECSLMWNLEEFYTEIYNGAGYGVINNQMIYGKEGSELDEYALYGLNSINLK